MAESIIFKQLRATKNSLIIDIEIPSDKSFRKVEIDSQDTYSDNYEGNRLFTKSDFTDETEYNTTFTKEIPQFSNIDFEHTLFIVKVTLEDETTSTHVTLCTDSIFREALSYMREIEETCAAPKGFIDSILRYKALQLAIITNHFVQAIKYYKKFYAKKDIKVSCGCCNCISYE